jgi:class 3 adenylate cyclase
MNGVETRFAQSTRGEYVAYQVVGDGPIDVLVVRPAMFPVDLMWDEPRLVHFLNRLSSFCRHIWFDARGTGASDPIPLSEGRLVENTTEDMLTVIDAVGCERVALLGLNVPTGLLFSASHPERTTANVLVNTTARVRRDDDYPEGLSEEELALSLERASHAETFSGMGGFASSLDDDARFQRWLQRAERLSSTPTSRLWTFRAAFDTDLRGVLGSIRVPTLVISREDGRLVNQGRYMAEHIDGARYVKVPGADSLAFVGDASPILDAIEEFLTGELAPPQADRVLATVLFTDLVDSTRLAARLGDRHWRELVETHDVVIETELDRYRGRGVKSTGDGVLALFDGPARAIRAAIAIRDALRALGLEVRAGVHTGEIELVGDDVAGISVHTAQRVASLAGSGEVWVSRTVADLLAGSGITFHDRGEHELKGVPGTWRLFAVPNDKPAP